MTLCPEHLWPKPKTPSSTNNFGGHKAVVRPDPIPNSAVKRSLADGSGCIASARVGCRQILIEGRNHFRLFFFGLESLKITPISESNRRCFRKRGRAGCDSDSTHRKCLTP